MKKLIFGDGMVPCLVCCVALCSTSDHYCSACGAPLRKGVARRPSGAATAVSTALARRMAEAHGTILQ